MAIGLTGEIFMATALCGIIPLFLRHLGLLRLYIKSTKFPGPRALPLIARAYWSLKSPADIMNHLMGLINTYPSPFGTWIGFRLYLFVFDPEQLKAIFDRPHTVGKGNLYKFLRPWLGTGLLTAPASNYKYNSNGLYIPPSLRPNGAFNGS